MLTLKCTYDFDTELSDIAISTKFQTLYFSKLSKEELFELERSFGKIEQYLSEYRRKNYKDDEAL